MADVVQQLQQLVQLLMGRVATLESAVSTASTSYPRRRLVDPEKFDGIIRYDTWLPQSRAVLRVDKAAIGGPNGDKEAEFWWLYGNLHPKIQAMVLPMLLIAEETKKWDVEKIYTQLKLVFGNPSKQDNARRLLYGIKQGNLDISGYLAKFERLLHDSRQTDLNDASKIAILVNGANDQLSKRLDAQLNLPSKYEGEGGFVEALHKLGSKSGAQSFQFQPSASSLGNNQPRPSTPYQSRPSTPAPRPRTSDDAMDLSRMQQNDDDDMRFSSMTIGGQPTATFVVAPKVSKAQRRAWNDAGLCRRCGGFGHEVSQCPMEPASQQPIDNYRVTWERDYGYGYDENALHQIEFRD